MLNATTDKMLMELNLDKIENAPEELSKTDILKLQKVWSSEKVRYWVLII